MTDRLTHADADLATHGAFLRTLGAALLRDADLAEDAAQETLVRALRSPPPAAPQAVPQPVPQREPSVRAWLTTVLRNVARNLQRGERRRAAREGAVALPDHVRSTAELAVRRETLRAVVDAVLALKEPYQSAILRRYFEDAPPREIARQAGVPVATAKSWLARGRAKIRDHLSDRDWRASLVVLTGTPGSSLVPPLLKGIVMSAKIKVLAVAILAAAIAFFWPGLHDDEATRTPAAIVAETPTLDEAHTVAPPIALDRTSVQRDLQRPMPDDRAPISGPGDEHRVRIEGRVVDATGRPLAGATVSISPARRPGISEIEGLTPTGAVSRTTRADGRFAIADLAPGAMEIGARLRNYVPILASPISLPRGEDRHLSDIVLHPSPRLQGQVVDAGGRPIDRARVITIDRHSADPVGQVRLRQRAQTSADGTFVLDELAEAQTDLAVLADGFVPRIFEGVRTGPGQDPVRLQLERGWSFRGRVEGAPVDVRGLVVRAVPASDSPLSQDFASFGLYGAREIAILPDRSFQVSGLAPDSAFYVCAMAVDRTTGGGDTREKCTKIERAVEGAPDLVLTYQASSTITLRAVDAVTGESISDFVARIDEDGRASITSSRADGTLVLPTVASDVRPQIVVSAIGYRDHPLQDPGGEPRSDHVLPAVELVRAPLLEVWVTDATSGLPLADAQVTLAGGTKERPENARSEITDKGGRAMFTLPDGERRLKISRSGYVTTEEPVAFLPDANATWHTTLVPEAMVLVHTEDSTGQRVPDVEVIAVCGSDEAGDPTSLSRMTDFEGSALFDGLAAGEYTFHWVRKQTVGTRSIMMGGQVGTVSVLATPIQGEPSTPITLHAGDRLVLPLQVPRRLRVSGTVREGGVPLENAELQLVSGHQELAMLTAYGSSGGPQTVSGPGGAYALEGAHEGTYTLVVAHAGRSLPAAFPLDLSGRDEIFDVHLIACAVRGVVSMEGGGPIAGARVVLTPTFADGAVPTGPRMLMMNENGEMFMDTGSSDAAQVMTDDRGEFAFHGLSPNQPMRLGVHAPLGTATPRQIQLGANEVRVESFVLKPAGALRVQLKTTAGAPRPYCPINLTSMVDRTATREGFANAAGIFDFEGLAPGSWEIAVKPYDNDPGASAPAPQVVQIEAGARQSTEIVVP